MLVKVCGITNLEAAQVVANESADFIGFVFAPSTRKIDPLNAQKISKKLPDSIKKVGVFVNESKNTIERISDQVGLDYIQLHGDETIEFANSLSLPIIKALNLNDELMFNLDNFPAEYFIIDSPGKKFRGGSGETFDWNELTHLNIDLNKIILAGGLNETNVHSAIKAVNPIGVDVSSGVEVNGEKDPLKIKQFIKLAKRKDE